MASCPLRYAAVTLVTAAALACAGPRGSAEGSRASRPAPRAPVRFFLVNDVYVLDTLRDGTGGLARVASAHRALANDARSGARPLFVLAGDVLSPSLLSKWYSGRQMVEGFNAAGLDYATFGNHEFEVPEDTLVVRIRDSRFKWISANCTRADGSPFPRVARWDTLTVRGTRVGLFGVTLPGNYSRYVRCADADSAAARSIRELRAAGAELVVGLTHQHLRTDSALLAREPELDLILGGHEHEAHTIALGGRYVLKADANSRSARVVTLTGDGGAWRQHAELVQMDARVPFDSATQRVARRWSDSLVKRLGPERVVGIAPVAIDARDFVARSSESALGNLVTDAMRLGTGADVALINGGTMRIDDIVGPGPLTNYDVESIFLFPDETRIVTFPITVSRLRELLEHGVSNVNHGRGGFLQVSGVSFRYDLSRPSGSRVEGDLRRPDGTILRPDETVRVAFVVYPSCRKGDGYDVPEAAPACAAREPGPRAVDLLLEHITRRLAGRIEAPVGGRITRLGGSQ